MTKIDIDVEIFASDVSPEALSIAKKNYGNLKKKEQVQPKHSIDFSAADLLEGFEIDANKKSIVAANLPYVSKSWDWIDKKTLGYEPALALYAEQDGLKLVFKLIDQFVERFNKGSILVLETDSSQQQAVVDYTKKYNLTSEKVSEFITALELN